MRPRKVPTDQGMTTEEEEPLLYLIRHGTNEEIVVSAVTLVELQLRLAERSVRTSS